MNYLAHGYRFLDDPLFMAGTAVPDWLSVVDRRVRVRSRSLSRHMATVHPSDGRLISGMLQHLADDDVFHRCPTFMMLESELGSLFRRTMPDPFDHRPGFLGHIVTELLLDAFIAENHPGVLKRYYCSMSNVVAEEVQRVVNLVATQSTAKLAWFIDRFREVQFLYDYLSDAGLAARLNQVLRRVTLPALEDEHTAAIRDARMLVREHGELLLSTVETARRLVGIQGSAAVDHQAADETINREEFDR
ncbi:MAG: hypothetical protein KDA91_07975 [Planctomycetaceae bacterium]|nr:hypothetical protein [Planctomycetaceae bacterium]